MISPWLAFPPVRPKHVSSAETLYLYFCILFPSNPSAWLQREMAGMLQVWTKSVNCFPSRVDLPEWLPGFTHTHTNTHTPLGQKRGLTHTSQALKGEEICKLEVSLFTEHLLCARPCTCARGRAAGHSLSWRSARPGGLGGPR